VLIFMSVISKPFRVFALLLGLNFLAAQFHLCADLSSSPVNAHMCPICSVAGSMVVSQSPAITMIPQVDRLEVAARPVLLFFALPRAISPRAPPAL
jgi:hypothetical protein